MVEIENRVRRGGVRVSARISSEGEMRTAVNTEVACAWNTLHNVLEGVDVVIVKDVADYGRGICEALVRGVDKIARETSRVIPHAVPIAVCCSSRQGKSHWSEIHFHILERSRLDASTSVSGG
jgi:hypothetical protein